jgi:hypothetical protein
VDSGYPNRPGYLAPYKGTKYHLPEFRQGPMPRGIKELFNFTQSSLRNVIERSFGNPKNEVEDFAAIAKLSDDKTNPNSYCLHGSS